MNREYPYNETEPLMDELKDAAFEYLLLNPGSEFGDWSKGLIEEYPAEVVDALGNTPNEVNADLADLMVLRLHVPAHMGDHCTERLRCDNQGKCLANFEDIGYSNIDEVTKALVSQFPADIPDRSMVQFKIVNLDKHQKGKGF